MLLNTDKNCELSCWKKTFLISRLTQLRKGFADFPRVHGLGPCHAVLMSVMYFRSRLHSLCLLGLPTLFTVAAD